LLNPGEPPLLEVVDEPVEWLLLDPLEPEE
jgi:hypothetical protein